MAKVDPEDVGDEDDDTPFYELMFL